MGWNPARPNSEGNLLKVGLTGGVACGKSTVLAMFAERGAQVLRADEVAHLLMQPGKPVYERIIQSFGTSILDRDGSISRPALAQLAFAGRIEELNTIVHPAVIAWQDEWMAKIFRHAPRAIAVVEAALMVEAGSYKRLDKLITVTCSLEQKIQRFAARSGLPEDAARREVELRMAAQISEEEKVALSDHVIDNSGTIRHSEEQVDQVWSALRKDEEARARQIPS